MMHGCDGTMIKDIRPCYCSGKREISIGQFLPGLNSGLPPQKTIDCSLCGRREVSGEGYKKLVSQWNKHYLIKRFFRKALSK
jgi:hypothetical protein